MLGTRMTTPISSEAQKNHGKDKRTNEVVDHDQRTFKPSKLKSGCSLI